MYEYRCKLVEVYDGDTLVVDIDLGFDVWLHRQRVRIKGVDTPEIRSLSHDEKAMGVEAREFVRNLVEQEQAVYGSLTLVVETYDATEKYGRILGDFKLTRGSLREEILAYGRGHAYDGGKR